MQRSERPRACALSNGPIPFRASARAWARFCPSGLRAGMRPSAVALEQPDAVVVVDVGVALHLLAARHVLHIVERALGKRLGFLDAQDLLVLELGGPFERRKGLVGPVALHVRLAITQTRYARLPWHIDGPPQQHRQDGEDRSRQALHHGSPLGEA